MIKSTGFRQWILFLSFVAVGAALTQSVHADGDSISTTDAVKRSPNIILFLADDLGYTELGCYGQKWIKTPNIDKIAENGMRFTDFYAGCAVCAPSRCVLMTGKHLGHAYTRGNANPKGLADLREKYGWEFPGQEPIPDEEVTIAEALQQKGYATGAMGKWGLGSVGTTGSPANQGFDLFYGYYCQVHAHNHYPKFLWRNGEKELFPGNDRTLDGEVHSNDRFTEVALEFVEENQDKPFFLYVPFIIPHLSIQTTDKFLDMYKGIIPEEEHKHHGYLEHPYPRAGYAGMVTQMDDTVGQVMAKVKELGLDDDTLVIFTSDNGPTYDRLGGSDSEFFNSAEYLRGLKGSLYEGGIRVPMVAQWPGHIPSHTVSSHVASFYDIFPTLAQLTDAKVPADLDGTSFLPTLLGDAKQKKSKFIYWEYPEYGGQQAVRMGKWKAIRQNITKKGNPDPLKIELYNLMQDIGEQNDVADANPEIVEQVRAIMEAEHTEAVLPVFRMKPLGDEK